LPQLLSPHSRNIFIIIEGLPFRFFFFQDTHLHTHTGIHPFAFSHVEFETNGIRMVQMHGTYVLLLVLWWTGRRENGKKLKAESCLAPGKEKSQKAPSPLLRKKVDRNGALSTLNFVEFCL
jgi:hypothetical protein